LHHSPGTAEGKKEIVMIELKAVLNSVVIDFGGETAEVNQLFGVA